MVDHFCGLKIDHKLELARLLNWNIGRFGAAEYPGDQTRLLTVDLRQPRTIGGESAFLSHLRPLVDSG